MKYFFFSLKKARKDYRRRMLKGGGESSVSVLNKVLMENPEDFYQKILKRLKTTNPS
ncbi:MAG: hypothetical protein U5L10_03885 [Candidatus Moranbacteria bacterium]|nr:hypothetical protein [Candidatus Moranbacteria bacterium]